MLRCFRIPRANTFRIPLTGYFCMKSLNEVTYKFCSDMAAQHDSDLSVSSVSSKDEDKTGQDNF